MQKYLILALFLLLSCTYSEKEQVSISEIPYEWNGEYSLESNPYVISLVIKDGKIFSYTSGEEIFPKKFMDEDSRVYFYNNTAYVISKDVKFSFSRSNNGELVYSSSTKTLTLRYIPYKEREIVTATTTTLSTFKYDRKETSAIESVNVPVLPSEWDGIYARQDAPNRRAIIIKKGKVFSALGQGDVEIFPKGLERVLPSSGIIDNSSNIIEVSSEFGNMKMEFVYNNNVSLRKILHTNFDGSTTTYIVYVGLPKIPKLYFSSNIGSRGEGRLNKPYSLTIDDKNIYIMDTEDNLIQVFRKSDNKFMFNFGGWGGIDGKFNGPKGITNDDKYLYISDTDNNRIQIFDKSGKFIKTIGDIEETLMEGYFSNPRGVAVDDNNIYVVESGNNRLQVIDKNTYSYVHLFGSKGRKLGFFNSPRGIAVDDTNLYVADSGNHRIQIFDKKELNNGEIKTIGKQGGGNGELYFPEGIGIGDKYIYIVDYGNSRIVIFDKEKLTYAGRLGEQGDEDGQFAYPKGIAIDKNNFYVADTDNDRVSIFNSAKGTFVSSFGVRKPLGKEFDIPKGIAVSNLHVYISDSGNNRIQVLDKNGNFVTMFDGKLGVIFGQLYNPTGLFFNRDSLYVADTNNSRIVVFNRLGTSTLEFGTEGTRDGKFKFPMGVFADDENIIVADTNNHRIQIFDLSGNLLSVFGEEGFVNGTFYKPEGVFADKDKIYVANTGNNRIEIFNRKTLEYDSRFGREGKLPGEFTDIVNLYVDKNYIYTLERGSSRVQVFSRYTKELKMVSDFGKVGSGNGEFFKPNAMAVDYENAIYIADSNNSRVSTIRIDMIEQ